MDQLGRSSFGTMESFPNSRQSDERQIVMLCMIITNDVSDMLGMEPKRLSERKVAQQASQTVRDLRESLGPVMNRVTRLKWRMYFIYIILPAAMLMLILWGRVETTPLFLYTGISLAILVVIYRFALLPMFLQTKIDEKEQRIFQSAYNSMWRPRLFRYVQSTGASLESAMQKLYESGRESNDLSWLEAVMSYTFEDGGLVLFARSQMYVG